MSQENKNPYNPYPYDPFFQQNPSLETHQNYSFHDEHGNNNNLSSHDTHYMMSFNDFVHGGGSVGMDYGQVSSNNVSRSFDMYSSSSADHHHHHLLANNGSSVVPMTGHQLAVGEENCNSSLPVLHSSVSSSSTEVVGEEDSGKSKVDDEHDDNKSKKVSDKQKKKGEKRVKEQRFAFITKSDIDQLEDGYRWRKYGQKAVKNSVHPRSYYRCTAQKCTVKKRVERSFEDPSSVITTYEGQHNHHCPATLRGNAAAMLSANAALFGSSASTGVHNVPQHLLPSNNNSKNNTVYNSFQISHGPSNPHTAHSHHLPDFGMLLDLIDPSLKREDYNNP